VTESPEPVDFSGARLSPHAATELTRRGFPASELQAALAEPEQVLPVRQGRVVLHRRYSHRGRIYLLRVFVDVDVTPAVVVTWYRTSKIEKYWSTL